MHNNSNITCAIDIRVGGDDPFRSDLLEIAVLPLNHSYKLHQQFKMFQVKVRPSWRVDRKIARLNSENIKDYEQSQFDAVESVGLFTRWADDLQLKVRKKIIPLVWDWSFIKPYLQIWMGPETFATYIDDTHRELMSVINFINDRHDVWGEEVPVKFCNFRQALVRHNINLIDDNSLTANCMAAIELNHSLLRGFIPGFMTRTVDKAGS